MKRIFFALLIGSVFFINSQAKEKSVAGVEYQGIVAIVNGTPITEADLEERVRMVIFSSGGHVSPELRKQIRRDVLLEMINERLKWHCLQKFAKFTEKGRWVPEEAVIATFNNIAKNNNMTPEAFKKLLKTNGIDPEILIQQIRCNLSWIEYIKARYFKGATVSKAELRQEKKKIKEERNAPAYLIHKMYFSDAKQAKTVENMLRQGANFENVARQFSPSSNTKNENSGWTSSRQLSSQEADVVKSMKIGEWRTINDSSGYRILKLAGKRNAGSNSYTKVKLVQVALPLGQGHPTEELTGYLEYLRSNYKKINDLIAQAKSVGCYVSPAIDAVAESMDPKIGGIVAGLPNGGISAIQKDDRAVFLLCVLSKSVSKIPEPTDDEIKEHQISEKLSVLADREMQDLRKRADITVAARDR